MRVKRLRENAKLPTLGSKYAAGYDLYSCGDYEIASGCTVKIETGIAVEIRRGFFGAIYARSGLATKKGLRPANAVGIVDADYRGEVIVALYNDSNETQYVNAGDRVAQMIIQPYVTSEVIEVDELSDTDRGEGGFGSTGN